jgi:hypothetical protein
MGCHNGKPKLNIKNDKLIIGQSCSEETEKKFDDNETIK